LIKIGRGHLRIEFVEAMFEGGDVGKLVHAVRGAIKSEVWGSGKRVFAGEVVLRRRTWRGTASDGLAT
jgi:hypothetical protein